MNTLYYAAGGGLGHVTRARRVLDTFGLHDAAIVTTSEHTLDPRIGDKHPLIRMPIALERSRDAQREWLRELLRSAAVGRLIVDTFPRGIRGELDELPELSGIRLDHVARLMKFDRYMDSLPSTESQPRFETSYAVEELSGDHAAYLGRHSGRVVSLDLRAAAAAELAALAPITHDAPFWLIVHSGPAHEVSALMDVALELRRFETSPPRVLVATPCEVPMPETFERIDVHPAAALFPHAARIISAAGFNVMLESEPWREKHFVVPFHRRFDDQHSRAARRR
jgi:hypothetical protein